jgi:hypothetical protein
VSEENRPDDVQREVPPEYAEAYRRGYERTYRRSADEAEPTQALGGFGTLDRALHDPPPRAVPTGAHRDQAERPVWLVPVLLAALVALLLGSAFALGKVFSNRVSGTDIAQEQPNGVVIPDDGGTTDAPASRPSKPKPGSYQGATQAVAIGGATASCQAGASRDAAGHPVSYAPANVYDGDLTTAWRCNGDGAGAVLTLELPEQTEIGEVGLVPGYAKTDPRSGVDRYAENNRITKVRWTFDDGTSVDQSLDGSAGNRDMQTLRIPVANAAQVRLEVLESTAGSRNTIAVSEVTLGEAVD